MTTASAAALKITKLLDNIKHLRSRLFFALLDSRDAITAAAAVTALYEIADAICTLDRAIIRLDKLVRRRRGGRKDVQ